MIALAGVAAYVLSDSRCGVQFVEYRMQDPLDTPTAIAAAPDGTIWFTIDLAAAVGRIRNGKLERISTSEATTSIRWVWALLPTAAPGSPTTARAESRA